MVYLSLSMTSAFGALIPIDQQQCLFLTAILRPFILNVFDDDSQGCSFSDLITVQFAGDVFGPICTLN
ncbi:unnamed protein product [Gongylonema pulchrum]|uniref:Secreted protein n=1 Tax=Gongylonema pulchrum TaxID=637853 RepID=A0A183DPP3_9BILA|nr:unnamed protein product [Gongylonema pulchrum]